MLCTSTKLTSLVFLLNTIQIHTVFSYLETCTTKEGEEGKCVFIDECTKVLEMSKDRTDEEPLIKSQCSEGFDYVCCTSRRILTPYGRELSDTRFCGFQHSDDYRSNRNFTALDEFPWLAAVVLKQNVICQGSLINNRYVLSCAHCFNYDELLYSITKIVLGKYNTENTTACIDLPGFDVEECANAQEYIIEKVIVHPFYQPSTSLNDIALVKLNKIVAYSDYIRPICLPITAIKLSEPGDLLYTTGWGLMTTNGQRSLVKKKIRTSLITHGQCQNSFPVPIPSEIHVICTVDLMNNTVYSCVGDGGSPVMVRKHSQWHIEGIVSLGRTEHCEIGAGIHTRVSSYLEWIKLNIRP